MTYAPRANRQKGEPTLPLINIVFLMLIFFMVSAQLARPLVSDLTLVETDDPKLIPPPDAVILMENGDVRFRGQVQDPGIIVRLLRAEPQDQSLTVRIIPDRDSDASKLVELGQSLQSAGAQSVRVVTQRALK